MNKKVLFGTILLCLFTSCGNSNSSTDESFDDAYERGFNEGKEVGYQEGYEQGRSEGYDEGFDESKQPQINVQHGIRKVTTPVACDNCNQTGIVKDLNVGDTFCPICHGCGQKQVQIEEKY